MLILLPIFTKAEIAKPLQRNKIAIPESVPSPNASEMQKPTSRDEVSHRPVTRRVSGRDAFATPSISNALKEASSLNDKEPSYNQGKAFPDTDDKNQSFTQEKLAEAWKRFVDNIDSPHLKSVLSTKEPILKDEWHVEYELDNELQLHRLTHDIKPNLLKHLRRELDNESIDINFKVSAHPHEGPSLPYTESEKWLALVEKYPALASLKSKFGLDFDQY